VWWAHRAACLFFIGGGFLAVMLREILPARFGSYGGVALLLVGMLLATPLAVSMLARIIQPIARMFFSVESRLAADNLIRSPARTGVVIGALAAGVSLMFQVAGIMKSTEEPIYDWLKRSVTADLFVIGGDLTSATSSNMPMESRIGPQIAALPGVETTVSIRFQRQEFNNTVVYVLAFDAVEYHRMTRARSPKAIANLDTIRELREPNTVVVSENFAIKHGVGKGDVITLTGPTGPVRLRITGTIQDYTWSKGTIIMDRTHYSKLFRDELVDLYHVYLKQEGQQAESRKLVEQYAASQFLLVQDQEALWTYVSRVVNQVYRLAYSQQAILGIVAALGVVTALLISVLQRRRELGLLRAVGATQTQVLKSVLAEALLMGAIGTFLGFLVGIPLEWYAIRVVLFEETGFNYDVLMPWQQALGIAAVSIVVAILAGLAPAIHAVRLRIADAIAYE
jgi:putative ABC transport system permease protein